MMLPYLFAVNKHDYSKWLPVYSLDTAALPAAVDLEFRDGKFSVYQSFSPFRGISSDLAVIKDCHKIFKERWWQCRNNTQESGSHVVVTGKTYYRTVC